MSLLRFLSAQNWRSRAILAVLLLVWIGFWYSNTVEAMIAIWSRSATFTHGFLVLPISLWLIWRKKKELLELEPAPNLLFLVFVAFTGCFWLLGNFIDANVVMQLAFVGTVVVAVIAVFGLKIAHLLAFPLGFLFFAVPTGEFLLPFLMKATADVTVVALRLTGIPVHREGLQFVIPTGNWSVVEACSGIRYLIASITVGSLFAYLNYRSWQRRLFFVGISILVPVIANWIRAYLIVLIGHLSNNRLATGVDHLFYGWAFFGIVLLIMFMIGARWSETEIATSSGNSAPAKNTLRQTSIGSFGFVIGAAAMLTAVPPLLVRSFDAFLNPVTVEPVILSMPEKLIGEWRRIVDLPFSQSSSAEISSHSFEATYQMKEDIVHIHVSSAAQLSHIPKMFDFLTQDAENESFSSQKVVMFSRKMLCGNLLADINIRDIVSHGLETGDNKNPVAVRQFYYIGNKLTNNIYFAKIFQGLGRLKGRNSIIYSVVFYATKENADKLLAKFMRLNCLLVLDRLQHVVVEPGIPFLSKTAF